MVCILAASTDSRSPSPYVAAPSLPPNPWLSSMGNPYLLEVGNCSLMRSRREESWRVHVGGQCGVEVLLVCYCSCVGVHADCLLARSLRNLLGGHVLPQIEKRGNSGVGIGSWKLELSTDKREEKMQIGRAWPTLA